MATYNINGMECTFPSVPLGELQKYHPTPSTFLLAWARPADEVLQSTILFALSSAYVLGALARPPYLIETNDKRTIYLLEQPNKHLFEEHLTLFIGYCGVAYTYACPYSIAVRAELLQGDERIKEIDEWFSFKNHPLYLSYKEAQRAVQRQCTFAVPLKWINHKRDE